MKTKLIKLTALGLFIVILAIAAFFIYDLYPSNPDTNTSQDVTIVSGMSRAQVANLLYSKGIIKNATIFTIYSKLTNKEILPGLYSVSASQSATDILAMMNDGDYKTVKITIIEGWRATDIEDYLVNTVHLYQLKGFATAAQPYEGYLFPDTYEVRADITTPQLIQLMRNNFTTRTQGLNVTPTDVVIASIVEREAADDADRPEIASVYENRLKEGMPLDADPTIQYALGSWDPITASDYQTVQSPYNTYLHTGLPPGPISNPGLKSIQAAVNPAQTNYLYFFYAKGQIYLSTTFQEHLDKIAQYLQ